MWLGNGMLRLEAVACPISALVPATLVTLKGLSVVWWNPILLVEADKDRPKSSFVRSVLW